MLGWIGHKAFGDIYQPTCAVPVVPSRGAGDAAVCEACPACTCDEELRQLFSLRVALDWWRHAAVVLGLVAGAAILLLTLAGACWAGACAACCRRRPAAPAGARATGAQVANSVGAPAGRGEARATSELLGILASQEVRRA